jgi:hypothetical protein
MMISTEITKPKDRTVVITEDIKGKDSAKAIHKSNQPLRKIVETNHRGHGEGFGQGNTQFEPGNCRWFVEATPCHGPRNSQKAHRIPELFLNFRNQKQ